MSDILAKLKAIEAAKKALATPAPAAAPASVPASLPQINSIVKQDFGSDLLKGITKEARANAGLATPKEVAHHEVRNTLISIQDMLGKAHPLLPNAIVKVRRILKDNDDLVPELTAEEVGLISKGILEATKVVLVERASKAKGKRGPITADDIL